MKQKYILDPNTLQYTIHSTTSKQKLRKWLIFLGLSLTFSVLLYILVVLFSFTPTGFLLERQNESLIKKLSIVEGKLDRKSSILSIIEENDDVIYRGYTEMSPIPATIRQAGTGGVDKYGKLGIFSKGALMTRVAQKADMLESQIRIQQVSFDEIVELVNEKNRYHASIPAICPLLRKDYHRISDHFGNRFHPVLKRHKLHTGMDYAATIGTPVYSTGDGIVVATGWDTGYGNRVMIDHGFGYLSIYAHLSKMTVRKGDTVARGKLIGLVGNTGVSTGPHLHYEIRKDNVPVNPIRYYMDDLSDEDYKKIAHK